MPYIIETTPREPEGWEDDADFRPSRVAVATLDEARDQIVQAHNVDPFDQRQRDDNAELFGDLRALSAEGGSVGPLPDGTVIEVRHVDWIAMRALAGRLPVRTHTKPQVIDAFNSQRES